MPVHGHIGGWLEVDGKISEYFSSAITQIDTKRFGAAIGDAAVQQIWESLAALVALRLWADKWHGRTVRLSVKGDSVAMLTLLLDMRPAPSLGLIAREVALDVADAVYRPQVFTHIPGIANVLADSLSREFGPKRREGNFVPLPLRQAVRRFVSVRNDSYHRTLSPCPATV